VTEEDRDREREMARIVGQNTRTAGPLTTLVRPEYSEACHGSAKWGERGSDKAVSTTVYVRNGLLIAFEDGNPGKQEAMQMLGGFWKQQPDWRDSYKEAIASAAHVQPSQLRFADDDAHLGEEGKALVLDGPRLRISKDERVFETRLAIAVCTGKASSKVWTRVAMASDVPGVSSRVAMDEVKGLCSWFRAIADGSVKWGFDQLKRLLDEYGSSSYHQKAIVKATSLGIRDEYLAVPFERLYERDVTAADLLKNDDTLDDKLTSYCRRVSRICSSTKLSTYAESDPDAGILWFKMPSWGVLRSGEVAHRMVLYLMRDVNRHTEIIGLAYDDSLRGDIVLRSGAALSHVIGPWI